MTDPAEPVDAGFEIDQLDFVQLDPPFHEITDFDCGDEALNEFINSTEAATFQRERLGATTLVFHNRELVAYYTLAPSTLTKKEYAGDEHPDVEDLRDILANLPSLLLGRFAVSASGYGPGPPARRVDHRLGNRAGGDPVPTRHPPREGRRGDVLSAMWLRAQREPEEQEPQPEDHVLRPRSAPV